MRKILTATVLSIAALSITSVTFAAAKSNSHAATAPTVSKSADNSNGVKSTDRDKGKARADDRRNRHSVAKKHAKRKHHHKKPKK